MTDRAETLRNHYDTKARSEEDEIENEANRKFNELKEKIDDDELFKLYFKEGIYHDVRESKETTVLMTRDDHECDVLKKLDGKSHRGIRLRFYKETPNFFQPSYCWINASWQKENFISKFISWANSSE